MCPANRRSPPSHVPSAAMITDCVAAVAQANQQAARPPLSARQSPPTPCSSETKTQLMSRLLRGAVGCEAMQAAADQARPCAGFIGRRCRRKAPSRRCKSTSIASKTDLPIATSARFANITAEHAVSVKRQRQQRKRPSPLLLPPQLMRQPSRISKASTGEQRQQPIEEIQLQVSSPRKWG